jgi:hypothetical protein
MLMFMHSFFNFFLSFLAVLGHDIYLIYFIKYEASPFT